MSTEQPKTEQPKKTSSGLDENIANLVCYLGWWITGLIFYFIEKDNKNIKFNATQSIITFGGITIAMIACSILSLIPFLGLIFMVLGFVVWVLGIVLWILLMVKVYQGEKYKLPYVGDLAEQYMDKF